MRSKFKTLIAYLVFVAVAAVLSVLFFQGLQQSKSIAAGACLALKPVPQKGQAPAFELPGLDGKKLSLASLRGKVVLLHFWATWCPPCLEELPSLYRMQDALKGEAGFELVTVSVDDKAKIVKDFFAKHRVPALPVVVDPAKKVAKSYGSTKFPETYLIGKDGRLRYRFINKRDWASPAALTCLRTQL
jgi:peroxiredoxin